MIEKHKEGDVTGEETRILWLSKHPPFSAQKEALKKAFGKIRIVLKRQYITGAEDIVHLMEQNNCTEVVAVLPINYLNDLVKLGVKPLRSYMIPKESVGLDGRKHEFSHFERVVEVGLKTMII